MILSKYLQTRASKEDGSGRRWRIEALNMCLMYNMIKLAIILII